MVLGASAEKPASHHFPGYKSVIEEGLSPCSQAQGWTFPGGVLSAGTPVGLQAAATSRCHPALARSQLCLRHRPCCLCNVPVTAVTRTGFHNPAGRALGALPSAPLAPCLSPVALLSSDQPQQESASLKFMRAKLDSSFWASRGSFGLLLPSASG